MSAAEKPLYMTKAHVFQIDPDTKKKWLPCSQDAVYVSYYFDSTRYTYKIISVDGSKAIVNSVITPTMMFTKTSQKFGQWSDARANTVYGLGFASESQLTKFMDMFKEIRELSRQLGSSARHISELNGSVDSVGSSQHLLDKKPISHQHTESLSSIQTDTSVGSDHHSSFTHGQGGSGENGVSTAVLDSSDTQLKHEGHRLTATLSLSSASAMKLELEANNLRSDNARLMTALQESVAKMQEYTTQLALYKEDNSQLKKRIMESDREGGLADASVRLLQQELTASDQEAVTVRQTSTVQQQQIASLHKQLEEMSLQENRLQTKLKKLCDLEEENRMLSSKLEAAESQMEELMSGWGRLSAMHKDFGSKMADLHRDHEQVLAGIRQPSLI